GHGHELEHHALPLPQPRCGRGARAGGIAGPHGRAPGLPPVPEEPGVRLRGRVAQPGLPVLPPVGPPRGKARAKWGGAVEWIRTTDLLITNQLLYQLSYNSTVRNYSGFRPP